MLDDLQLCCTEPATANSLRTWRDIVDSVFPGFEPQPGCVDEFRAALSRHVVGELDVTEMAAAKSSIVHRRLHHRAAHRPGCCLILQLTGSVEITQASRRALLSSGDLILVDGTRPARFDFCEPYRHVAIRLSHGAVTERLGGAIPVGMPITGNDPLPEVVRNIVLSILRSAAALRPEQSNLLVRTMVDLVGVALTGDVEARSRAQPEDASAHLLIVKHYITRHLADCDLSPQTVARANGLSLRQLYRLFEVADTTPCRWILEQRLERSRAALLDPTSAAEPIGDIALSLGFSSFSHFSRSYKNRFGVTPREDRACARLRRPQRPIRQDLDA